MAQGGLYIKLYEPVLPNSFGEKLETLQCMSLLTFLPPSNFAVFDGWYFLRYSLQRGENCSN